MTLRNERTPRAPAEHAGQGKGLLIVGGYGAVGARLSRELVRAGQRVVLAGRNLSRAETVARQLGITARRLDLNDPTTWLEAFDGIGCVVVCMDQRGTEFAQTVLDWGIHYIDITANDEFFRRLEALKPTSASALLSVGLAPGLTNMLAMYCAADLDTIDSIEIGIMSAIGDNHGQAGIDWLMDQAFDRSKTVDGRRLAFGAPWGERTAYRIDFADQHILRRHLGAATTATRICLTSKVLTMALFQIIRMSGGQAWIKTALAKCLSVAQWRNGACVISVTATGRSGGDRMEKRVRYTGYGELEITARIGAEMIISFLQKPPSAGIWHSHQVLDFAALRQSGAFQKGGKFEVYADAVLNTEWAT